MAGSFYVGVPVKAILALVSRDSGKYCNRSDFSQKSRKFGMAPSNQGRSLYRAASSAVAAVPPCAAKKFVRTVSALVGPLAHECHATLNNLTSRDSSLIAASKMPRTDGDRVLTSTMAERTAESEDLKKSKSTYKHMSQLVSAYATSTIQTFVNSIEVASKEVAL